MSDTHSDMRELFIFYKLMEITVGLQWIEKQDTYSEIYRYEYKIILLRQNPIDWYKRIMGKLNMLPVVTRAICIFLPI